MIIYLLALTLFIVVIVFVLLKVFKKNNTEFFSSDEQNNKSLLSYILNTNKKIFIPSLLFLILDGIAVLLIYNFPITNSNRGIGQFILIVPMVFFGLGVFIFIVLKIILAIVHFNSIKKNN